MGILTDTLLELLESVIEPSGDRGLVGTFAAASVAIGSVTLWLMLTAQEQLMNSWGLPAYVGSLAFGGAGALTSVLHLSRNESDRAFAVGCLTANVAAISVAVFGIVFR
jgi:hypothetical protein